MLLLDVVSTDPYPSLLEARTQRAAVVGYGHRHCRVLNYLVRMPTPWLFTIGVLDSVQTGASGHSRDERELEAQTATEELSTVP